MGEISSPPAVSLPDGYSEDDVAVIESSMPAPDTLDYHYVPVGKVYDVSLGGAGSVEFKNGHAVLSYSYDDAELATAGLVNSFMAYYYDVAAGAWIRVDHVEVDRDGGEIRAYTSHFTPFVLAALKDPWIQVGGRVDGEMHGAPSDPSLAFDGSVPYIVWGTGESSSGDSKILVKRYDRHHNVWIQVGSQVNTLNTRACWSSLAVADGVPYVAYTESDGKGLPMYVKAWNGSEWAQLGGAINKTIKDYALLSCKLICVGNVPHIITCDGLVNQREILVYKWNGTEWVPLGGNLCYNSNGNANYPSLAYDGTTLYAAWKEPDGERNVWQFKAKRWTGTSWEAMSGDINVDASKSVTDFSLISGPGSALHVAFIESPFTWFFGSSSPMPKPQDGENRLYVRKWDGAKWQLLGGVLNSDPKPAEYSTKIADQPSIALVKNVPYVAWTDYNAKNVDGRLHIFVKKFDGTDWFPVGESLNISRTQSPDYPYTNLNADSPCIAYNGVTYYVAFTEVANDGNTHLYVKSGNWQEPVQDNPSAPMITKFNLQSGSPTIIPLVKFELDGRDDKNITHWMITGTPDKPLSSNMYWQTEQPNDCLIIDPGASSKIRKYNMYAWAKDEDGNVSDQYYDLSVVLSGIDLESVSSQEYAAGTFGKNPGVLTKGEYPEPSPLTEGVDFEYGRALDGSDGYGYDVIDQNVSGYFSPGKYFRVVVNGKNIVSDLNLVPVAKDLAAYTPPPPGQAYIDPLRGKFILPQPVYWSKCESVDNIRLSEIRTYAAEVLFGPITITQGKFGGGCLFNSAYSNNGVIVRLPQPHDFNSFTMSFYSKLVPESVAGDTHFEVQVGNLSIWAQATTAKSGGKINTSIRINNEPGKPIPGFFITPSWISVYIIGDSLGRLQDGKTIRVFVNGKECVNSSVIFNGNSLFTNLIFQARKGSIYFDNIMVWNDVQVENSTWVLNNESALSPVYGDEYGYSPSLNIWDNSGVGYYFSN